MNVYLRDRIGNPVDLVVRDDQVVPSRYPRLIF